MDAPRTARIAREERKARFSDAYARIMRKHGVSKARAAADCGVGETKVAQWADPEADSSLPACDVEAHSPAVRVDLAELVAGPGWCVCVLPAADRLATDVAVAARIACGGGAVLTGLLEAHADGQIDRAEAAALVERVAEHVRELMSLKRGLEMIATEGAQATQAAPVRPLRVAGGAR